MATTRRSPVREAVDKKLKPLGGLDTFLAHHASQSAEAVAHEIFLQTKLLVSTSTVRRWLTTTAAEPAA